MKASDVIKGMGFTPSDEQVFLIDNLLKVAVGEPAPEPAVADEPKPTRQSPWLAKVLKMGRKGSTATEIAAVTDMSGANVSRICRAHEVKLRRSGSAPVTEQLAGKVLAMAEAGVHKDTAIAVELGMSDTTVRAIRLGHHPVVGGNGRATK